MKTEKEAEKDFINTTKNLKCYFVTEMDGNKTTVKNSQPMYTIEVVYFTDKNWYSHRKDYKTDLVSKAVSVYEATIEKLSRECKNCLIVMRDGNDKLLKSYKTF